MRTGAAVADLTDEPKRYISPDEKLARAEERIELLEAEHDALKRQDESRCRAWAVERISAAMSDESHPAVLRDLITEIKEEASDDPI